MEKHLLSGTRVRIMVAAFLAAALSVGLAFSTPVCGGGEEPGFSPRVAEPAGSGNMADRQLLGLYSHSWARDFKKTAPASEWKHVRNARLSVGWGQVEYRKGKYGWRRVDDRIEAALSMGINSLLITIGSPIPEWAANPATPIDPTKGKPRDYGEFEQFCKKFAERYKGYVSGYQIWNEPGWDLNAPPAEKGVVYFYGLCEYDYLGLLRAGYNGIKAADPGAYVISGAMMNGITREPDNFVNYELLMDGANQDFSMKVESDRQIVAERPMYFNYQGKWTGGHDQVGIESPGRTWYLAEGATHPGFEQWICIQNPGDEDTGVNITYMFPGGETQGQSVMVKAHSRYTVDVNTAVGPYKDVSARLESEHPVVVERPMYFDYNGWCTGGSIEAATAEMSDTWYLAEGTTNPGFEQWISIMNPNPHPVDIEITYMFQYGLTHTQNFTMPRTSRETVMVNEVVGPGKDVSARVTGSAEIIAERPMYFNYQGKWTGGHNQIGAIEPATSWFLSEGTTRNNPHDGSFEEWISIQNPKGSPAKVDITYMFNEGGTQPGSITVPARARETILVNEQVGENRDVSVRLESDVPVVVERPMYFNYRNKWPGGHVELGCTGNQDTWYFAEGTTRVGFEEWLTLQNPNPEPATATVTCMFADGTVQKKQVALPPSSRTTVDMNRSVSMGTICDAVAVHPYDYPEYWAWYYGSVVNIVNRFGGKEVVVTEIGWPHAGRDEFSMEGQRRAIGEVGIGSLWDAGCRKIWVYEDVDDPPGTSWDDADNGMFTYHGQATPAWGEYKKWQSILPDYGNLPRSIKR